MAYDARVSKKGKAKAAKKAKVKPPKKKCCDSKPKCRRCPLRMLAEGTLPDGYGVKHRKLVRIDGKSLGDSGRSKKKRKKDKKRTKRARAEAAQAGAARPATTAVPHADAAGRESLAS